MAAAAVVLLTDGKEFLVDMGGLTGVWSAFSFVGLGLVLVGIGYLYQRLQFGSRRGGSGVGRALNKQQKSQHVCARVIACHSDHRHRFL